MPEQLAGKYEVVPIDSVHLHPHNANRGNLTAIAESIQQNDFYGACICQQSTRYILVGNHRKTAALQQGATTIPVIFIDVPDDVAIKILLVDNRSRELAKSDTDEERLLEALEIVEESQGGLGGTGYVQATLARLREEQAAPLRPTSEEAPKPVAKAKKANFRAGNISFSVEKEEALR